MNNCEVIVVGAGPAGVAAAIAARRRGFQVTVLDSRKPPIDKPCGEGILPQGVAALRELGIAIPSGIGFPFRGIQFTDPEISIRGDFPDAPGLAVRRVKLHQLLVDHAMERGVNFRWGERVLRFDHGNVVTSRGKYSYQWLIGADGQNSFVRKSFELDPPAAPVKRFGFCSHFWVRPWSDAAEVHWTRGCQIFITPLGNKEVGVAVLSADSQTRLANALPRFPFVEEKLRGATLATREWGDTTILQRLPAVARGRVALVGDASGSVDAVTGCGLNLSFQQAIPLGEALTRGDLDHYQSAHKRLAARPAMMSRLLLLLTRNDGLRRGVFRAFHRVPGLFSRMVAVHAGTVPGSFSSPSGIDGFGRKFLASWGNDAEH